MQRIYENPERTSENRLSPRAYYIPKGRSEYRLLNGEWRFAFFPDEALVPQEITKWDTICNQNRFANRCLFGRIDHAIHKRARG